MSRDEEKIKAGRDFIARNYGKEIPTLFAFEAGFDEADEHPKNPWRDAKNDPPKDTNTVVAIFNKYSKFEKWLCSYNPEEKIWDMSDIICDPPDYWMPIPELPKD